jgi:electron transfer flavoprotein alpha subunit
MSILVIAEHNNTELNVSTLHTVTAASQIGGDITVLVAGHNAGDAAKAAAAVAGVSAVLHADAAEYANGIAENMIPLIAGMADQYSHILAPATTFGKNIMPGVAALKDVAQISDIINVVTADTFQRPIYAGNALATVQSGESPKVITVRSTAFEPADASGGNAAVSSIDGTGDAGKSSFVKSEVSSSDRPELLPLIFMLRLVFLVPFSIWLG